MNNSAITEEDGTMVPGLSDKMMRLHDIANPSLGVLITASNLIVVISSGLILKNGQQPRSTYLFLGNVALSDLVMGISLIFDELYSRKHRNVRICSIQIGVILSAALASAYSVALIAIDRFLYILYGLQYQHWIYTNRARLLIVLTWILGLIIGTMAAAGLRGDIDHGRRCLSIIVAPPNIITLTSLVGIVPVVVVVVLYSIILHHALRKVIQLNEAHNQNTVSGDLRMHVGHPHTSVYDLDVQRGEDSQSQLTKKWECFKCCSKPSSSGVLPVTSTSRRAARKSHFVKWKAIKVVLFTTGSFVVTWVPSFIVGIIYVTCEPDQTPQRCTELRMMLAGPLAVLGGVNSLLNPMIYAWWHNGFRESAIAIFGSCCSRCRSTQLSLSDRSGSTATSSCRIPPRTSGRGEDN